MTARAAVLAVAFASVVLALALPFKVWVGQRSQINDLLAQTKSQERHIAALQDQEQRWQDPAYVEQQARLRLHYAMPGETTYVVLDHSGRHRKTRTAGGTATPELTGPWYSRLWQSVEAAGQ